MIRLAKYQSDYKALYRGLQYLSHVRQLAAPEINDMYFAKSTLGENYSEEMLAYYRDYLARYPQEAAIWNTYQYLIESTGDLERTLETVKAREQARGADITTRNKVAELYWRLGDEESAFEALDSFKASVPLKETVFWMNYAELAWRLRKDGQAYASAEVLFKERVGGELMPERMGPAQARIRRQRRRFPHSPAGLAGIPQAALSHSGAGYGHRIQGQDAGRASLRSGARHRNYFRGQRQLLGAESLRAYGAGPARGSAGLF